MNSPMPDRDDDAADWVVRMAEPTWSDSDEAALQAWLAADPRHSGALLQAQALWSMFDEPAAAAGQGDTGAGELLSDAGRGHGVGDQGEGLTPWRVTRRWLLGGTGAAIAASVAGAFLFLRDARYATAVGEIRRVPLGDGSIASINTDSSVAVELASNARRVELTRGEAWFQVAKDAKRPFIVAAGRVRAQAVGTAFSVRRRDDGADILVTEGVVEAWADGAEGNRIRLMAGESAFVADNALIKPAGAGAPAVDRALAWRAGKIDLVSTPLSDAAAEFNRYNSRQIEIVDPALRSEQLDGQFGTNDPETFAAAVRDGLSVPVDLSDPARIRIGRARP
ncbi:hypothetical protein ASE73_09455 [Sphingomonas sp. Leaf24]|uniref:FecR family protein n=2 Tax=unclassified Sphingomonas TaxID=196159 RepID=UPI0007005C53|nr:FecR domain-containing protein [Sphingomonas sp. Leaf24]KQM17196.1 hypothetical protein ASE50_07505 [Sphingomonas sp. Leaf5]KQM88088.1 hypothetical protein ASE73_09455 [Sphingomonas sp. Leaf24]